MYSLLYLPVQVPIQAVVVWNEFILPLVVELALEVHVLEHGQVGLVARQGDGSNVHQAGLAVVVQNLKISQC